MSLSRLRSSAAIFVVVMLISMLVPLTFAAPAQAAARNCSGGTLRSATTSKDLMYYAGVFGDDLPLAHYSLKGQWCVKHGKVAWKRLAMAECHPLISGVTCTEADRGSAIRRGDARFRARWTVLVDIDYGIGPFGTHIHDSFDRCRFITGHADGTRSFSGRCV